MINTLISIADHEVIKVYRFLEVVADKGGTMRVPELIRSGLVVSIQPASSLNSVGGQTIVNMISGKTGKEVYIAYSPQMPLKLKDLIFRNDGIIYEVQRIEHNGRGTLLQHDKYYIVEYDNQKVLVK